MMGPFPNYTPTAFSNTATLGSVSPGNIHFGRSVSYDYRLNIAILCNDWFLRVPREVRRDLGIRRAEPARARPFAAARSFSRASRPTGDTS